MTLLVIIRPEPGAATTLAAARAHGHEALSFPLFKVEPVNWMVPEPETFDAVLIGSANALRHGGAGMLQYHGKPAYAVGATTAKAADAAGLTVVATGSGGMQALFASLAPSHRHLLRLSGQVHVALSPPTGITLIERVVYDSVAQAMPKDLARLLATRALTGAVVLLHSAEAAGHFSSECDRLRMPRAHIRLAALGPRIAAAAGSGWMSVASAEKPGDAALLALAGQLCQSSRMLKPKR